MVLATSPGLCCWMEVAITGGAPGGLTTATVGWPTPFTAGFTPAAARVTVLVPVWVWLMGDWATTVGGVLVRITEFPAWLGTSILACIRGLLWFTT